MSDSDWKIHDIQIHVEHVLPVLASSLYGNDPGCAVREALQNAHDALIQLQIENEHAGRLEIHIFVDRSTDTPALVLRDNGVGMTEEEVHEKLAKIGGTTKDEIARNVEQIKSADLAVQRQLAEQRIGRFGLGFLASFIVARKAVLRTRRYDTGRSEGVEAVFDGHTRYRSRRVEREHPGTELRLELKPEYARAGPRPEENLTNTETIESLVRRYADLLTHPVFVHRELTDMQGRKVTHNNPPWTTGGIPNDYDQFYKHRFPGTNTPLAVFPLKIDRQVEMGGETVHLKAGGLLYIPNPPEVRPQDFGVVELYVKGLYVCQDRDQLLPQWATYFCNAVIDTPSLTETLDRNNIVRTDSVYLLLREELGQFLIHELRRLEEQMPQDFETVMAKRAMQIRLAAIHGDPDGEFLKAIAPSLPVTVWSRDYPYPGKSMPLRDYLENLAEVTSEGTQKCIRYFYHRSRSMIQDLAGQSSLAVIEVPDEENHQFLTTYLKAMGGELTARNIASDLGVYVKEIDSVEEKRWQLFVQYFNSLDGESATAHVREFRPAELPALYLAVETGEDHEEQLRNALSSPLASIEAVEQALRARLASIEGRKAQFYFYINAGNRLMQQLLDFQERSGSRTIHPDLELVLHEVLHNAKVYAGLPTSTSMNSHVFEWHQKVLQRLLELVGSQERSDKRDFQLSSERDRLRDELAKARTRLERAEEILRINGFSLEDLGDAGSGETR